MDLDQIILRAQAISEKYKERGQSWNPFEQIAHIHSEVSEIHRVLRNKNSEYDQTFSVRWTKALTNEIADAIILTLDIPNLTGKITITEIERAIDRKLKVKEKELGL